jgi:hypothetical protein
MRAASTAIVATLCSVLMAGAAVADPATAGGPRRGQTPAATPDFAPAPGQVRPTARSDLGQQLLALQQPDTVAQDDAAVDALLGMLPQDGAAAEGAKHIYVDENGDLACVTLDTFLPEPC